MAASGEKWMTGGIRPPARGDRTHRESDRYFSDVNVKSRSV